MKKIEIGDKFGRLVVLGEAPKRNGHKYFLCECDCGKVKPINGDSMRAGDTRSCGCYSIELRTKHGHCTAGIRERIYEIWAGIKKRCLNKKAPSYKNYGGRGITVCKEWLEFMPFYNWAMSNGYTEELMIERTDNNGNYNSGNCIWATRIEQNRNQRIRKDNKTGYPGVFWSKNYKQYIVYINDNLKQIHLGYFTNIQDAITARKAAELKYWGKT